MMIETKRLRIYPAAREQMEVFIAAETDADLKTAYTEMLEGCLRHPDQWHWYAMWLIELRDGTHIGDLCFKGLGANGTVEIGYGVLEEYQGHGYAAEAVDAVVVWALKQPDVIRVEAETAPDNLASQRVLEKSGFLPSGTIGEDGPRFFRNACEQKNVRN
jgi:RimJ/RimL family protein N-acetyltransferase